MPFNKNANKIKGAKTKIFVDYLSLKHFRSPCRANRVYFPLGINLYTLAKENSCLP